MGGLSGEGGGGRVGGRGEEERLALQEGLGALHSTIENRNIEFMKEEWTTPQHIER
jgi:hypothetical protein